MVWKYGDKIYSNGIHKKVSDLFVNFKLPIFKKSIYPIFENSNGEIVWIPGIYVKEDSTYLENLLIKWKE